MIFVRDCVLGRFFFWGSSVSSVFLCFPCFLVKTMFFGETYLFFLKGLQKDTFQDKLQNGNVQFLKIFIIF